MARSLSSAYAFFQGIDDQQAYNLKANEDERKRLEEERKQQLFARQEIDAETRRANEFRDYAAAQTGREIKQTIDAETLRNLQDPLGSEARQKAFNAGIGTTNANTATTNVNNAIALSTADKLNNPEYINTAAGARELAAKVGVDERVLSDKVKQEIVEMASTTYAKGSQDLRNVFSQRIAGAFDPKEAQRLITEQGLPITLSSDGKTFQFKERTLPIERLQQILKNPAEGFLQAISGMLVEINSVNNYGLKASAQVTRDDTAQARIALLEQQAAKAKADAEAAVKNNTLSASTQAPVALAKPGAPFTPASQPTPAASAAPQAGVLSPAPNKAALLAELQVLNKEISEIKVPAYNPRSGAAYEAWVSSGAKQKYDAKNARSLEIRTLIRRADAFN